MNKLNKLKEQLTKQPVGTPAQTPSPQQKIDILMSSKRRVAQAPATVSEIPLEKSIRVDQKAAGKET